MCKGRGRKAGWLAEQDFLYANPFFKHVSEFSAIQ